ncbi:unnamed protein product [marine sediment metagenome]|uniref:Uncharacterized protein n=1 Tax=marine sediment metagenome TaxID=412755 RepID=X1S592_9ZZZZ
MSNVETGKRCPNCGAEGDYHGEHETVVKNYRFAWGAVADVGWRCWSCGYEWGFELPESSKSDLVRGKAIGNGDGD